MTEHPEGAILQRDGRTYAVMKRSPAGLVTPEFLERVAAIARNYHVPTVKITADQRTARFIERITRERLGSDLLNRVPYLPLDRSKGCDDALS